MFTLYILYNTKLDKFYIGYTADVEKRLREHNSGISTFTSKPNDWGQNILKKHIRRGSEKIKRVRYLIKSKINKDLASACFATF